jgi:hypothetical protein
MGYLCIYDKEILKRIIGRYGVQEETNLIFLDVI